MVMNSVFFLGWYCERITGSVVAGIPFQFHFYQATDNDVLGSVGVDGWPDQGAFVITGEHDFAAMWPQAKYFVLGSASAKK